MTQPIDLDAKRAVRPRPFKSRSLSDLATKTIPDRDWLIPSILLRRSITLFAGDGGVGKSLMCQQLQVAAAMGLEWLGLPIQGPIQSFGFYCEDDDDELDRRFSAICRHYGVRFEDVADNVRYISRVGEANELVTFKGKFDDSKPSRTSLFDQIEDEVSAWGTQLIIVDTAADTFAGNENIRPMVRAFVNQIRRLALINNGGVILNAHPSKSAMLDGSGFSGSTAWNGSVRNRLYLTSKKTKDEDGDDAPSDDRVLRIMKSNYGPFGEKIKCRWERGVFVTPELNSGGLVDRLDAKNKLLSAARKLLSNGSMPAAAPEARNSLCNLAIPIIESDYGNALSWAVLRRAQEALVTDGRLFKTEMDSGGRKKRMYIRPTELRFPGEETLL